MIPNPRVSNLIYEMLLLIYLLEFQGDVISRCLSPPYPIRKSFAKVVQKANLSPLQEFLTQLYFVAHSSFNKTNYYFFFAFVGPSFSAAIMLLQIEGVKIHGTD